MSSIRTATEIINELHAEKHTLLARVRSLEAGLREFGRHGAECATEQLIGSDRANAILRGWVPAPEPTRCDCGLDALLEGVK